MDHRLRRSEQGPLTGGRAMGALRRPPDWDVVRRLIRRLVAGTCHRFMKPAGQRPICRREQYHYSVSGPAANPKCPALVAMTVLSRDDTQTGVRCHTNPKSNRGTIKALSDVSERASDLRFRAVGGGGRI